MSSPLCRIVTLYLIHHIIFYRLQRNLYQVLGIIIFT